MRHIISLERIIPDDSKIAAITKMCEPGNKLEVQMLVGLLTDMSNFIDNFSEKKLHLCTFCLNRKTHLIGNRNNGQLLRAITMYQLKTSPAIL